MAAIDNDRTDTANEKLTTLSRREPLSGNERRRPLRGGYASLASRTVVGNTWRQIQSKELAFSTIAFLLLFVAWNEFITWNWTRISVICRATAVVETGAALPANAGVLDWKKCETYFLGADPLEYELYFRKFPGSIRNFVERLTDTRGRATLLVEFNKRPLFGPLTALVTSIVGTLSKLAHPERMHAVLAVYASICSLLLFRLLRWVGSPVTLAFCATAVATASFSWLSVFSIPESYSLSVVAMTLAARSGLSLNRVAEREKRALVAHSLVIGLASWIYLPACGAVILAILPLPRRPEELRVAITIVLSVFALALSPQLMRGGLAQVEAQVGYGMQWGGLWNLFAPNNWLDVIAAFSVFSIVAPAGSTVTIPGAVMWHSMPSLPVIAPTLCVVAFYTLLFRSAILNRVQYQSFIGPSLWLFSLVTFHVVFNPREALLYTSPPLVLIVLMTSLIIKQMHLSPRLILPIGLCIAGALAAVNLRALT